MISGRGGFKPAEPGDNGPDWPEIWGKRIGRTLGALFLALLIVNLFTGWFF